MVIVRAKCHTSQYYSYRVSCLKDLPSFITINIIFVKICNFSFNTNPTIRN